MSEIVKNQVALEDGISDDIYSVNVRSGKMTYRKRIMELKSYGIDIALEITYKTDYRNSQELVSGVNTGIGYGFKFNYHQVVYKSGEEIIYIDGGYKKHIYKLAENLKNTTTKVYYDEKGSYGIIEETGSGYILKIGNTTKTFDGVGKLTKISTKVTDEEVKEVTIMHDFNGRIIKVQSGTNVINITYNTTGAVVSVSGGRSVNINVSNGVITSIVDVNNVSTTIDVSNKLITSITRGKDKVEFTYLNGVVNKVIRKYNTNIIKTNIINYLGEESQVLEYGYSDGVNSKKLEIEKRYVFDSEGRLGLSFEVVGEKVCGVEHYKYGTEEEVVKLDSGIESSVGNITVSGNSTSGNYYIYPQTKGEHVLSVVCKMSGESTQTNLVYADVYVNEVYKTRIEFDSSKGVHQGRYIKLELEEDSSVYVRIVNNTGYTANIKRMSLTPKQTIKYTSCTNIANGNVLATFANINLYKSPNFSVTYTDGSTKTISGVKMSFNDIKENQRLANLTSNHCLWYEDGKKMLYNVGNVSVSYGSNTLPLLSITNGLVNKVVEKVEEKVDEQTNESVMDPQVINIVIENVETVTYAGS